VQLGAYEWRLLANVGLRQNELSYKSQTGDSMGLSMFLGSSVSFFGPIGFAGQQWHLVVGGGSDYVWQHWQQSDGLNFRTFANLIPKVLVGVGTSFATNSGHRWGLIFRREYPFATDNKTGDVLALGANTMSAFLEW
jgi:hypothetical protein